MKSRRQDAIVKLLQTQRIETQEELAEALRELGFRVTQATISRDIRAMHLMKVPSQEGGYQYAVPEQGGRIISDRLIRILRDSLIHVESAGHMVVVKTLSGSAGSAAEALDLLQLEEMLGSIAGDNTIFIVAKDQSAAEQIVEQIRKIMRQG